MRKKYYKIPMGLEKCADFKYVLPLSARETGWMVRVKWHFEHTHCSYIMPEKV